MVLEDLQPVASAELLAPGDVATSGAGAAVFGAGAQAQAGAGTDGVEASVGGGVVGAGVGAGTTAGTVAEGVAAAVASPAAAESTRGTISRPSAVDAAAGTGAAAATVAPATPLARHVAGQLPPAPCDRSPTGVGTVLARAADSLHSVGDELEDVADLVVLNLVMHKFGVSLKSLFTRDCTRVCDCRKTGSEPSATDLTIMVHFLRALAELHALNVAHRVCFLRQPGCVLV